MPLRYLLLLAAGCAHAQTPCESLASLKLMNASVVRAERRDAGALPSHCRISLVLTPSSDSHIESEVWLPLQWNGKFLAVGNGGWAGSISVDAMGAALRENYATASTDTGHRSSGPSEVAAQSCARMRRAISPSPGGQAGHACCSSRMPQ